jgi:regulator of RNase E activity RraA
MAERPAIPAEVVKAYSEIDVACIADVLFAKGWNCVPEGIFPIARDMKVCGQAVTMRHIASRYKENWARHEKVLVEHCKPGDVLVIDMGGRRDGSTFGGNISADAQHRGLSGVVIDGTNRDTDEIIELGFSVFSRGVSLRHTHGTYYTTNINSEPVQIGEIPFCVMVAPGDLVCGDADGIAIVPGDKAEEILPHVLERHEQDLAMKKLMREGRGHGDPEIDKILARVRELEGVKQAEGYRF